MERVTARTHAEIGQIKDVLLACGADGAAMSGSGPTTFGLFRSEDKARKAYAALRRDFPDTHLTRMQPGWGRETPWPQKNFDVPQVCRAVFWSILLLSDNQARGWDRP